MKVLNELRQFYPLDELLRAAEIPRSTFYYHLKALSKPDKYADVKKRIGEIYHENRGRYGYRRVTLSLHREGKQINHKAVQRLMGTLSLKAAIKVKRYRSYRGEVGQTAPNVLQRDFKATWPNEKWVTDVTEFAVNGRKLYLSPVIDLFNNEVISYSLSERPVMNMVENMLDQAFKKLNPHEHPVLQSERFGFGLRASYSRSAGRIQVLSLLATLSTIVLWLLGYHAANKGLHLRYQANSIKSRRVISYLTLAKNVLRHSPLALGRISLGDVLNNLTRAYRNMVLVY